MRRIEAKQCIGVMSDGLFALNAKRVVQVQINWCTKCHTRTHTCTQTTKVFQIPQLPCMRKHKSLTENKNGFMRFSLHYFPFSSLSGLAAYTSVFVFMVRSDDLKTPSSPAGIVS